MVRTKKAKILAIICTLGMLATMFIVPFTASAASVGVSYSGYQAKAWTSANDGAAIGHANKGLSMEALKANLTGTLPTGASISYKIYENKGWHSASDGAAVGNANKNLYAEALEVSLTGMPGYTVSYSIYENKSWQSASDGAPVGHANKGYKIEAVRITIVPVATTATTVSAINSTIAVGGTTGFTFADANKAAVSVTGATFAVTSANASTGFLTNGIFTATAAGAYTISATVGSTVLTTVVNVCGAAVGITLSTPASVEADGLAKTTVTATLVDANGNTVVNSSQTFTITGSGSGSTDANNAFASYVTLASTAKLEGGSTSGAKETFTAVNGVATITVVAPSSVPSTTDSLVAYFTDANSATHTATVAMSYISPVATTLKLNTSATQIAAGSTSGVSIPIQVLDKSGNPMTGTYAVTATVTGSAYLAGNVQSQMFSIANGAGSITVYTPAYASGTVTIALTSSGLAPANLSLAVGTAGTATKLSIATTDSATFTKGVLTADSAKNSAGASVITGTVEDANGMTTTASAPATITYTVTLNGTTEYTTTANVTNGAFSFDFGGMAAEETAGTYVVTVSSNGLNSATTDITVLPGAIAKIAATSPTVETQVSYGSPSTTVSFALEDAEGNAVATSGIPVSLYTGTSVGTVEINGGSAYTTSGSALVIDTDSTGTATATVTLAAAVGNHTVIDATANNGGTTIYATGSTPAASPEILEVGATVSTIAVTPGQTTAYTAGVAAGTSGTPMLTINATGNYGSFASGDVLQITFPSGLFNSANVSGHIYGGTGSVTPDSTDLIYNVTANSTAITVYGATPGLAGNYTVKVVDLSVPSLPQGTAAVSVTNGTVCAFNMFDTSKTNLSTSSTGDSIAAGGNLAVSIVPVDAAGNIVATDDGYTVTLPTSYTAGNIEWRSTLSGANITSVTFTPGQTSPIVVYLVNNTSSAVSIDDTSYAALNVDAAFTANGITAATVASAFGTAADLSTISYNSGAAIAVTTGSAVSQTVAGLGTVGTFTVTLYDASGDLLANRAIYISGSTLGTTTAIGTLSAAIIYTNANGQASFTYTTNSTSANWVSGTTTEVIKVKVGGGSATGTAPAYQLLTLTIHA